MNTTDCEKIECILVKEFNVQRTFNVDFDELKKNVSADDEEKSKVIIKKVDTFMAIENPNKEIENHYDRKEIIMQSLKSRNEKNKEIEFDDFAVTSRMAIDGPVNTSAHIETLKGTQSKCTELVFTLAEQPLLDEMIGNEGVDGKADFDDGLQPLSERWSPLGANYDDALTPSSELLSPESELELLSADSQDKLDFHQQADDTAEIARLKCLEEEQEMLTSSLMALTSHFAHVQLRVRQIVEAPPNERDQLLKDLEEFAFQGIPESHSAKTAAILRSGTSTNNHNCEENTNSSTLNPQQFELIDHLKNQLIELEKIAYESGAPVLPQHILFEKQKIIINELKHKLNINFDEKKLPQLTAEELKTQVDNAIGEFVGPLKMKEKLVAQLKTQITDLERFIAFLQCDTDECKMKTFNGSEKIYEAYNSYAAKKKKESHKSILNGGIISSDIEVIGPITDLSDKVKVKKNENNSDSLKARESLHSKAHSLMDKASLLMQMFATTHFGSKQEQFQKNTLKKTHKGNHWGDLRAQLEVDIQEVASLAATLSFDCEKLAKLRKAIKKSKTFADTEEASLRNGIVTIPPSNSRNRSKMPSIPQQKQLKPYTVSSGSDDEDFDAYDYYDWQQQNNRRMVQCARIRGDTINTLSKELTTAVRKNFAMTLLKLIQHGLRVESISPVTSSLIVPFMRCLNPSPVFVAEQSFRARDFDASPFMSSSASFGYDDGEVTDSSKNWTFDDSSSGGGGFFSTGSVRPMHGWELILEYYYLKHGDEYNNTPARKLSQSFNLNIINSQAVTPKQNLLSVVGSIIAMHRPYKRSYNAHFKAFVCAGLNCHQLVEWLNLIFSCTELIENYYTNSSYVACTGFRDALCSIDTLSKYDFDLPVDLAIRHFRNL